MGRDYFPNTGSRENNTHFRRAYERFKPPIKSGLVGTQPIFNTDQRLPPTDQNGCSIFRKNY